MSKVAYRSEQTKSSNTNEIKLAVHNANLPSFSLASSALSSYNKFSGCTRYHSSVFKNVSYLIYRPVYLGLSQTTTNLGR